jgi:hypothetical protein
VCVKRGEILSVLLCSYASSWLSNRPRLSAGSRFLQEPKQLLDALQVGRQMREGLGAAVVSEVLQVVARSGAK